MNLIPFNDAPDEISHYNYIKYIVRNHKLPIPPSSDDYFSQFSVIADEKFADKITYEYYQPPLYYFLAGPFFILGQKLTPDKIYLFIRFFSLILGVLSLIFIYKISRFLFKENIYLRLGPVSIAAALPLFVHTFSVISNDSLAILTATAIIFLSLQILKSETGDLSSKIYFYSLITSALAIYVKLTIYPFVLILAMLLFLKSYRDTRCFKKFVNLYVVLMIFIAGLWFGYNQITIGNFLRSNFLSFSSDPNQMMVLNLSYFDYWLNFSVENFFGTFGQKIGQFTVRFSDNFYLIYKISLGISFLGIVSFLSTKWDKLTKFQKQVFWLFLILFSITLISFILFNLKFFQPQARYFFPVISLLVIAFVLGWQQVLPKRLLKGAAICGFLGMILINVLTILLFVDHFGG